MEAKSTFRHLYRCYGRMDQRGRWRAWQFSPLTPDRHAEQLAEAACAGHVLFASVQRFAPPVGQAGLTRWRKVGEQYRGGENPLPHIAPLYFDIDCDGDLDKALRWTRSLVEFLNGELELPEHAVRVWFSGSKGAHVLVSNRALNIQPSATLTTDMKKIALSVVDHLVGHGAPQMTIDSSVYSLPRMLRLSGQLNPKSGLYKVELSHEELLTCSTDQITALAKQPRPPQRFPDVSNEPIPKAAQWWADALARAQQPREFRIKTAQIAGQKVRPDGYVVDELTDTAVPSCIKGLYEANVVAGIRNRCELQIACWVKAATEPPTA